jgi:hypothetical protein
MEAITDFVDTITAYKITIPLSVQMGIILLIIVVLCVSGYFMRDIFDVDAMRSGFSWFIFIAVLNLLSLLVIFFYYNSKNGTYKGPIGKVGKKGRLGKKGTTVSCSLCKNNLYLQKVRSSTLICNIYTNVPEFKSIFKAELYFDIIIENGNKINFDSFVDYIIFKKTIPKSILSASASDISTDLNMTGIDNFRLLLNTNSITVLLIKAINQTTKALEAIYGSFRRPNGIQGKYLPLGDAAYGGSEYNLELNSFMADGNILYPGNYTKLISFFSYNPSDNARQTYSIWRPNGQTINERDYKGAVKRVNYKSLGDICRSDTTVPQINETLTIGEKCLQRVHIKDLELVFVFIGNIQLRSENIGTRTDSYLIEHNPINDIELFSIWRTPLNTFLTNCNTTNIIVNNTFVYNMYNISADTDTDINPDESAAERAKYYSILNNYGNVSSSAKIKASNVLSSIQIPNLLAALILCKYYEIEIVKDLVYYINLYRNTVPEFKTVDLTLTNSSLSDFMTLIDNVNTEYEKFNKDIARAYTLKDSVTTNYDQKEKYLPPMITNIYNDANNKLLGISIKIANIDTLLDIVNIIFDNGIETRIAVDSDGIAKGGVFMNSIQEVVLRVCKMVMPPNIPAYTIKDECLGTFALDRKRETIINEFIDSYNYTVKLIEQIGKKCALDIDVDIARKIMKDPNYINTSSIRSDMFSKCIKKMQTYITYTLNSKIGQIAAHVDNYLTKINNGNLGEFTTTRIKALIKLFNDANIYLKQLLDSDS